MRISDWSSDVCSSDLARQPGRQGRLAAEGRKSGEGVRVGLLHHVLGLGIVAYHGARDPEQALVAALNELAERTALAAPCQCHPLGVGQGGRGDCFGGGAIGQGKLLCVRKSGGGGGG